MPKMTEDQLKSQQKFLAEERETMIRLVLGKEADMTQDQLKQELRRILLDGFFKPVPGTKLAGEYDLLIKELAVVATRFSDQRVAMAANRNDSESNTLDNASTSTQPPVFERAFAMANKWTFTIKPIKELLAQEVGSGLLVDGLWCDPFAGQSSPAQVRNDIDPEANAEYHLDALEFLQDQATDSFDGVLYDPPYSFRQAKECYDHIGVEAPEGFSNMAYWSKCKQEVARITKTGGKVICFGWNTMGIGKMRGFKMARVLMVPHGGNRNDTLVTVEVKHSEASTNGNAPQSPTSTDAKCQHPNCDSHYSAKGDTNDK